jgi:hypothetical protein
MIGSSYSPYERHAGTADRSIKLGDPESDLQAAGRSSVGSSCQSGLLDGPARAGHGDLLAGAFLTR